MSTQWWKKLCCGFKLECKVRELKSQGEVLILVLRFPLIFENACFKETLGFELNPPNHRQMTVDS